MLHRSIPEATRGSSIQLFISGWPFVTRYKYVLPTVRSGDVIGSGMIRSSAGDLVAYVCEIQAATAMPLAAGGGGFCPTHPPTNQLGQDCPSQNRVPP